MLILVTLCALQTKDKLQSVYINQSNYLLGNPEIKSFTWCVFRI